MKAIRVLFAVTALAPTLSSLKAQSVLIDFGTSLSYRGVSPASPDANGNHWNSFRPGQYLANMVDSQGVATTIDIGLDASGGTVGTDSYNGPAGATSNPVTSAEIAAVDVDAAALGSLGAPEAVIDYITSTNGRIQIQGLNPAKTYRLEMFASRRFAANPTTEFIIYSDNTYATPVASASVNVQDPASPWLNNRSNLAVIANLAPQANNIFYLRFAGAGGTGNGSLNAIRIIEEPGRPASFTAKGSPGGVDLGWGAVSGAVSYNVSRSSLQGSGFTVLAAGVPRNYYRDNTAEPGVTYYYIVSAVNTYATGPASVEASGAAEPARETVLIDFGTDTTFRGVSAASPDFNGNHWNGFAPGLFLQNLVTTSGAATTIDLGLDPNSVGVGTDSYNGPAGATSNPVSAAELAAVAVDGASLGSLAVPAAVIDFFSAVDGRLQIQGLDPAKVYKLEIFGSRRFVANPTTTYSLHTDDTYSSALASVTLDIHDPISPGQNNRANLATFSGVTPQAANTIFLRFEGAINAMRLSVESVVPQLSGIDAWRVTYFGSASAAGNAASDTDPDLDGLANLLEYALGGDPLIASSGPNPTVAASPALSLTFNRVADPALVYSVEAADDLGASPWTLIWSSTGSENAAGPVTVADPGPVAGPRRFLRLRVALP